MLCIEIKNMFYVANIQHKDIKENEGMLNWQKKIKL